MLQKRLLFFITKSKCATESRTWAALVEAESIGDVSHKKSVLKVIKLHEFV